jgi:hypothetical protein
MTSVDNLRTLDVPLYRIAQARSGDKADTADITVFLPNEELYQFGIAQLSADAVRKHLSPLVLGDVVRYEIPRLFALKFVCHAALGGGGSSSLRSDNLGKSMASALLRMPMRGIPADLVEASPLYSGPPKKELA